MVNSEQFNALPQARGGRLLVLYDGHCALCNGAVRWLVRHDRKDRLRFAPLECFPELAKEAGESILVVGQRDGALTRSTGVLAAIAVLPQPWRLVGVILRAVPPVMRDWAYNFVARNRYRLKKRLSACPMPGEAERGHFYTVEGPFSSDSGSPPAQ